jgi:hypothetical protein
MRRPMTKKDNHIIILVSCVAGPIIQQIVERIGGFTERLTCTVALVLAISMSIIVFRYFPKDQQEGDGKNHSEQ